MRPALLQNRAEGTLLEASCGLTSQHVEVWLVMKDSQLASETGASLWAYV